MNNASEAERRLSNMETNDTSESSTRTMILPHTAANIAILLLCVLGTPGNVFVIVVYRRALTTSLRLYMFSLAVSDMAICVSYTFVSTVSVSQITVLVIVSLLNMSMMFSTILLTFLSVERCVAVSHPHKFTLRFDRTKTVLVCFAGVSLVYTMIGSAALAQGLRQVYVIMSTGLITVCFCIMVTSYSVMAAILLKRIKLARVQVSTVTSDQPTPEVHELSAEPSTVHKTKAKVAQKVTVIVFIVTTVFILCWLPFFLKIYGLPVSDEMKRMFVVNSVVNPFIYTFISPAFRRDVRQFCGTTCTKVTTYC